MEHVTPIFSSGPSGQCLGIHEENMEATELVKSFYYLATHTMITGTSPTPPSLYYPKTACYVTRHFLSPFPRCLASSLHGTRWSSKGGNFSLSWNKACSDSPTLEHSQRCSSAARKKPAQLVKVREISCSGSIRSGRDGLTAGVGCEVGSGDGRVVGSFFLGVTLPTQSGPICLDT